MPFEGFSLDPNLGKFILVGQVGSKSYGTATPESDDDYLGVAIAPKSYYIGLDKWPNEGTLTISKKEELNAEMTVYELKKFLKLMLAFNPNVTPLLYLREQDYVIVNGAGRELIENRKKFESKEAYRTLIGYAYGQMTSVLKGNTGKLGKKRKELVEKYGYDTKFASHTVRILNMAVEFFETGNFNVYRTWDRDLLIDIRNGKMNMNEWISFTDSLLQKAKEAARKSFLPEKPDRDFINSLCMHLIVSIL